MTYNIGGTVQALDYNTFANAVGNINQVWSTGATDSGYGQTLISNVAVGGSVTSAQWTELINDLNKATNHQTGANSSLNSNQVEVGDTIVVLNGAPSELTNAITAINTRRGNAATQGSTATTTFTNPTTWSNTLTYTTTVTFASADQARYFFNAGGQLGLAFGPGGGGAAGDVINNIAAAVGTLWFSSPSSGTVSLSMITYAGVQKVGGSGAAGATINTSLGYYGMPGSISTIALTQAPTTTSAKYGSSNLTIQAARIGATVVFVSRFTEVFSSGTFNAPFPVGSGMTLSVTIRSPETTNLTNSWGAVSAATVITTT